MKTENENCLNCENLEETDRESWFKRTAIESGNINVEAGGRVSRKDAKCCKGIYR